MLTDEIRLFVWQRKNAGLNRADVFFDCLTKFGKENETLINYVIMEEIPNTSPQYGYRTVSRSSTYAKEINFAKFSMACGILSLIIAGIIFGPLAIYFGARARENGESATAGTVCGIIGLIASILIILATL